MVALLDKSPLPSKTALRARGATSHSQSLRAIAVKSCNRIELGRFTYDACVRLGLCSNERNGFVVGSNPYVYVDSTPTDAIDPLGTQAFRPRGLLVETTYADLTGRCRNNINGGPSRDNSVEARFKFWIKPWPCRGNHGYFLQHVSGFCLIDDCGNGLTNTKFEYWEAWPIAAGPEVQNPRKRNRRVYSVNDKAKWTPNDETRGIYSQHGEIRFYCLTPPTLPRVAGEIEISETSVSSGPVGGEPSNCWTTSGGLWGVKSQPGFWNREPAAGTQKSTRDFSAIWSCCKCPKSSSNWIIGAADPLKE